MHRNTGFTGLLASYRIALLAAALALGFPASAEENAALRAIAATDAPALSYTDEQGATHRLNAKENRLTAVHFWATWCIPCLKELPDVDAAQAAYADKGFKIIAVSLDGDHTIAKVKNFFAAHRITHLTPYLDIGTASFQAARSKGLPTTLFIDSSGREIARAEGPLDWKSKEVTTFMEKALQ